MIEYRLKLVVVRKCGSIKSKIEFGGFMKFVKIVGFTGGIKYLPIDCIGPVVAHEAGCCIYDKYDQEVIYSCEMKPEKFIAMVEDITGG